MNKPGIVRMRINNKLEVAWQFSNISAEVEQWHKFLL
jgi:hypothetical protein